MLNRIIAHAPYHIFNISRPICFHWASMKNKGCSLSGGD